jgi:hypothetical protein
MHIGDMTMRLRSVTARNVNGENKCDMKNPREHIVVALSAESVLWQIKTAA